MSFHGRYLDPDFLMLDGIAGLRRPLQWREYQTADGFHLLMLKFDSQALSSFFQTDGSGRSQTPLRIGLQFGAGSLASRRSRTTSPKRSLPVMNPAAPPYSSMTTAICAWSLRMAARTVSISAVCWPYAAIPGISSPWTSVRRMCRPLKK